LYAFSYVVRLLQEVNTGSTYETVHCMQQELHKGHRM